MYLSLGKSFLEPIYSLVKSAFIRLFDVRQFEIGTDCEAVSSPCSTASTALVKFSRMAERKDVPLYTLNW